MEQDKDPWHIWKEPFHLSSVCFSLFFFSFSYFKEEQKTILLLLLLVGGGGRGGIVQSSCPALSVHRCSAWCNPGEVTHLWNGAAPTMLQWGRYSAGPWNGWNVLINVQQMVWLDKTNHLSPVKTVKLLSSFHRQRNWGREREMEEGREGGTGTKVWRDRDAGVWSSTWEVFLGWPCEWLVFPGPGTSCYGSQGRGIACVGRKWALVLEDVNKYGPFILMLCDLGVLFHPPPCPLWNGGAT